MNQNVKRWLISSAVSFLSGFALVVVMGIDDLTLQTFQGGAWVGFFFLAVRSGVKAVAENFLARQE